MYRNARAKVVSRWKLYPVFEKGPRKPFSIIQVCHRLGFPIRDPDMTNDDTLAPAELVVVSEHRVIMDGMSELARILNKGSIVDKLDALDGDADGVIPAGDLRAYAKEQGLQIPADALEQILSAFSRDSNSLIHIEDVIQVSLLALNM
jgi:hypothetical protein